MASDRDLDAPDAALAQAVVRPPAPPTADDDLEAPYTLDDVAAEVGAGRALLDAVARTGLLLPHHVDEDGEARYSAADLAAVRAGLTLLDAGLPLGELLDLARRTDAAVGEVATAAVDAFLRFVRDPVRGTSASETEAAQRLVTAYEQMLPATERLVAHHVRRRVLQEAAQRVPGALAGDDTDGGA
ncbi:MerR family transcriptional regulator [Egicoccus sp. AB-alg6-2]|uniref:MerR family transcriptional regulator n=1 Tax=Egicoccus sp. AB-alg6-2 TaxID=3242692 RepID=UPI00359D8523